MIKIKFYLVIGLVCALCACGGKVKPDLIVLEEPKEKLNSYLLDISIDGHVPFSGYANFDEYQNTANNNGVMYSGYNAGTFLLSVLVHAAVSVAADDSRMEKFIKKSNEVALERCNGVIETFQLPELEEMFIPSYQDAGSVDRITFVSSVLDTQSPKGYIFSDPAFILTAENDTLIIENKVRIHKTPPAKLAVSKAKEKKKKNRKKKKEKRKNDDVIYEKVIVVVSDKIDELGVSDLDASCGNLKSISSKLYADTMTLFSDGFNSDSKVTDYKYETIKYYIGDHFRVERGKVINKSCDRVVFESLKGWIKSVPQENSCSSNSV